MQTLTLPAFDAADVLSVLAALDESGLDQLDFGAIGFDAEGVVRLYNRFDSEAAGLRRAAFVDYGLTLRRKPTRGTLRLVARPGAAVSYVLVRRRA